MRFALLSLTVLSVALLIVEMLIVWRLYTFAADVGEAISTNREAIIELQRQDRPTVAPRWRPTWEDV